MKYFLIPCTFLLFVLNACNNKANHFTVNGKIDNMPAQAVILEELGIKEISVIDSVQANKDGQFQLKGNGSESKLYRIRFTKDVNKYLLLSLDKGEVKLMQIGTILLNHTLLKVLFLVKVCANSLPLIVNM